MSRTILVTGSAGFIGANFVQYWASKYPTDYIIGVDSRTYAASDKAIQDLKKLKNYQWIQADITHAREMDRVFHTYKPQHVFHFAAESHVCRSIEGPEKFFHTNVIGTVNLLGAFTKINPEKGHTFYYVSTDEIYGEATADNPFNPDSPLKPRSPYAASKAAANFAVDCYRHTYGIKTLSSSCTNNFGKYQHEEKLLPKTWISILNDVPLSVYGTGKNIRDWLPVESHCQAIETIFHEGKPGTNYTIGSNHLRENLQIISEAMIAMTQICPDLNELKLEFSNKRPTDDKMYAVDTSALESLGWKPPATDDVYHALNNTAQWYMENYAPKSVT